MKKDELKNLIKAAANPDNAAEALANLSTAIDSIFDDIEARTTEAAKLTEQVNSLRDSNLRLFLRVTEGQKQEPEEESPDKFITEIKNQIKEKFEVK